MLVFVLACQDLTGKNSEKGKRKLRPASTAISLHHPSTPFLEDIMTKFILVSGGVVSGIGKGVIGTRLYFIFHCRNPLFVLDLFFIASSTGLLLKTAGLKVTAIKIDPYMNIDAGTMRPTEHGKMVLINRPIKQSFLKLEFKGKSMSLTTAERSIWIWEIMSVILMSRSRGITILRLEKYIGK